MSEKFLIPGIVFILVFAVFLGYFELSIGWSFFISAVVFAIVLYFVNKYK
ncbi:MAG: hypothetical protein AABX03_04905 [Nanoarchaeota archaeon]